MRVTQNIQLKHTSKEEKMVLTVFYKRQTLERNRWKFQNEFKFLVVCNFTGYNESRCDIIIAATIAELFLVLQHE